MEEKTDALSEVAPAMAEVSKQTTSQIKIAKPGKNPGRVVARKKISRTKPPCTRGKRKQKTPAAPAEQNGPSPHAQKATAADSTPICFLL